MNPRVLKTKVEEIPGAWIFLSAYVKNRKESITQLNTAATVSFVFYNGDIAAEWEPNYGPIQLFERGEEGEDSRPHYVFPFVKNNLFAWSQMDVEREGLPEAFINGDYKYIFAILEGWTQGR
jgi:hypothetical protein